MASDSLNPHFQPLLHADLCREILMLCNPTSLLNWTVISTLAAPRRSHSAPANPGFRGECGVYRAYAVQPTPQNGGHTSTTTGHLFSLHLCACQDKASLHLQNSSLPDACKPTEWKPCIHIERSFPFHACRSSIPTTTSLLATGRAVVEISVMSANTLSSPLPLCAALANVTQQACTV